MHVVGLSKPGTDAIWVAERGRDYVVGGSASRLGSAAQQAGRVEALGFEVAAVEIRMVEQVEEVQAEFHAEAFLECLVIRKLRNKVAIVRTEAIAAWGVSDVPHGVADQSEGSRVHNLPAVFRS